MSLAGKLNTEEMEDMLSNMRLAAPIADEVLVQLLTRWASAGRQLPPPTQPVQSCCIESAGESAQLRQRSGTELVSQHNPLSSVAVLTLLCLCRGRLDAWADLHRVTGGT